MKKMLYFALSVILITLVLGGCSSNTATSSLTVSPIGLLSEATVPDEITISLIDCPAISLDASEEETALFEKGNDLWYNDNPSDALTCFKDFLSTYPDSPLLSEAQYYIGICYRNMSNFNEALNAFATLITNYPDSDMVPDAYYNIAYIYRYSLNDVQSAIPYYVECLKYPWRSKLSLVEKCVSSLSEICAINIKYDNYLFNLSESMQPVMNGSGTEVIGSSLYVLADKSKVKSVSEQDWIDYLSLRVSARKVNWFTIVFNDGTGIEFPSCVTAIGMYGVLDSDYIVTTTYSYIRTSEDDVVEELSGETLSPIPFEFDFTK